MIGLEYIVKEFHTSYKEVAQELSISTPTIQDWLRDRKGIPAKRLDQLSQIFNLQKHIFKKNLPLWRRVK